MRDPRIDRPAAVRAGEELDLERLSRYLVENLPEAGEPHTGDEGLEVLQFPSGFSNLTYLLRFGGRELVLRRPPFGSRVKSAHDMGREYRILSRLGPVFPKVPEPLLYCDDEEVLGAAFYVMEWVRGEILRPRMDAAEAPDPQRMAAIAQTFLDTLVELHGVDFEAAGLGDLGRPHGYVERQVEGWIGRYRKARTDEVPEMEAAARWLAANRPGASPRESEARLIHNDFKYDNLVLDPRNGVEVVAVLDWEMATLGDPLMDLGTSLGYWVDPDDPPELRALQLSPTTFEGNPARAEIAARYGEASGRDLGDLVFYYVYGLFKIAVIVQQIYYRYRKGHTSDPRFAHLDQGVFGCARTAVQAIAKRRIDRLF